MNYRALTDTDHAFPLAVTTYDLSEIATKVSIPIEDTARMLKSIGHFREGGYTADQFWTAHAALKASDAFKVYSSMSENMIPLGLDCG